MDKSSVDKNGAGQSMRAPAAAFAFGMVGSTAESKEDVPAMR